MVYVFIFTTSLKEAPLRPQYGEKVRVCLRGLGLEVTNAYQLAFRAARDLSRSVEDILFGPSTVTT